MIDINSILDSLEQQNWLDWGVILQAWKGLPCTDLKLSTDYISDYAIAQIEKAEEDIPSELIELFDAELLEKQDVTDLLEEICDREKINKAVSLRKLRLAALEKTIDKIPDNCIYALIELTDFWVSWNNPHDKPHVIQGLDSSMNPTKYYSEKNYQNLLKAHKFWIEQEKINIINSQSL